MIKLAGTFTGVIVALATVSSFGETVVCWGELPAQEPRNERPAQAPASWLGKKVVTKYGAPVHVENQKAKPDEAFRVYTVEKVDGDRVWLVSDDASGWIEAAKIVLLDQAIDFYSQEIRAKLDNAAAYHQRGLIWKFKEENEKAIADYTEAIRLDPKDAWSYANRGGIFLEKKENNKAVADFTEAIQIDPQFVWAYANRAYAWTKKKDYDKAIADYTDAIRIDPRFVWAYQNRGDAWSKKNECDKAIADYTRIIQLDPKFVWAYTSRAAAWSDMKEQDKAIADITEVIRLDPIDAGAYNFRALIWAKSTDEKHRDAKSAVESATKACELTKWNHAPYLETLAVASARAGDFESAVKWQTKANDLYSDQEKKARGESRLKLYQDGKTLREITTS